MSEDTGADKTEAPTARRLEDALAKGQTPFSREPAVLASLAVLLAWTAWRAPGAVREGAATLAAVWSRAGTAEIAAADVASLLAALLGQLAWPLAPLLAGLMIAGAAAGLVQAEPRLVAERVRPQASRVSPAKGWGRLFGRRGLAEFAKSLAKVAVAGAVAFLVLRGAVPVLADLLRRPPHAMLPVAAGLVTSLLAAIATTMLLVAAADVAWSRHAWRTGLRMTRKEVSDESKRAEGDPILKARRRSLARDRSRRRMLEAVPGATLVIANPTHVAVALRYAHERDPAPVVVAKGGDHLCARIRARAEESGVPVFERVELARALYRIAEVDRPIPETFYVAVAELINTILRTAHRR